MKMKRQLAQRDLVSIEQHKREREREQKNRERERERERVRGTEREDTLKVEGKIRVTLKLRRKRTSVCKGGWS